MEAGKKEEMAITFIVPAVIIGKQQGLGCAAPAPGLKHEQSLTPFQMDHLA